MKMYMLAFVFMCLILECETNNSIVPQIEIDDLVGRWVNQRLEYDTLFWNDTLISRIDTITMLPKHSYTYSLDGELLHIKYTGEYYIAVLESSFKISLSCDKSILTIEGLHEYFPKYQGDEFKRIANR